MWLYLGFATVSVVTAGLASSAKFSKKVGITLTKKEGAKNLPKGAKKMSVKEYEKKYGKAYSGFIKKTNQNQWAYISVLSAKIQFIKNCSNLS